MPHLSEVHGAMTHLAVVAIPLYAVLLILGRLRIGGPAVAAAAPWVLGGAVVGVALSGLTGLLVHGQSQTMLRGSDGTIGTLHFWLGFVLASLVLLAVGLQVRRARARPAASGGAAAAAVAVLALVGVAAQGYLGGRMTYEHGVGVDGGGQFARSGAAASRLNVALASGASEAQAGKAAFARTGLGCASCHGDQAQGARGPRLAGGREIEDFRRVHAHGLFPPSMVTDRDFRAIDAWLRTLPGGDGSPES